MDKVNHLFQFSNSWRKLLPVYAYEAEQDLDTGTAIHSSKKTCRAVDPDPHSFSPMLRIRIRICGSGFV